MDGALTAVSREAQLLCDRIILEGWQSSVTGIGKLSADQDMDLRMRRQDQEKLHRVQ